MAVEEQFTVNVALSEPQAFQGGGTAFWPQGAEDVTNIFKHILHKLLYFFSYLLILY